MPTSTSKAKLLSRIISYFTNGDRKEFPIENLPKVYIDSKLISLSLLSRPFGRKNESGRRFWRTTHQRIILLFEWAMVLKWLFCIALPQDLISPVFIGDFVAYLPGKRIYYYIPFLLWTSVAAVSVTLFYLKRDKSELSWLKPFEVCKGSLKPEDVMLESREASHFLHRVLVTLWSANFIIRNIALTAIFVFIFIFGKLWPEDRLVPYGIIWALVSFFWVYHTIAIQLTVMAVFHQVCYYLIIRFQKVNEIANGLQSEENVNHMIRHQKIQSFMVNHNEISKDVNSYNKFWQFYMVLNFVIYLVLICFIINLVFFGEMISLIRMVLLASIFAFFACLSAITFSAGSVAEEAHNSYSILYSVSKNKMPILLKTQLQIYIDRLGGPTIGFTCWDLFTVTYDSFFHAILMIGSVFLLLMDVTQSEIRPRYRSTT